MVTSKVRRGFTIIETILVLAVTSVLIITMLVGAGASVARQRYNDSVVGFRDILQKQYLAVANVQNDRADDIKCSIDSDDTDASINEYVEGVGRSISCLIYGKLIEFVRINSPDYKGTVVRTTTIIGKDINGDSSGANVSTDIDGLVQATLQRERNLDAVVQWQTEKIPWQPTLYTTGDSGTPGAPTPTSTVLLIVRGPVSGSIRTFVSDSVDFPPDDDTSSWRDKIRSIISDDDNLDKNKKAIFCVNSPDEWYAGGRRAVSVSANSSNASGVEIVPKNTSETGIECH